MQVNRSSFSDVESVFDKAVCFMAVDFHVYLGQAGNVCKV